MNSVQVFQKNLLEAVRLYKIAANAGNDLAKKNLRRLGKICYFDI